MIFFDDEDDDDEPPPPHEWKSYVLSVGIALFIIGLLFLLVYPQAR